MQDFLDFYQFGGFFNNVVSLFSLAGVAMLVKHAVTPHSLSEPRTLGLAERLALLGIAAGVLGTLFNVIEMSAALATIDPDLQLQAGHRALGIVPIPLVWSLLCAIPIWLGATIYRHRLPL